MAVTPRKLLEVVAVALEDGKAEDAKFLDVHELTSLADYMVIASGRSSRQVKALADRVADAARAVKVKPLGIEGEQAAEWVLVDLGDVIVHVMQPESRAFYQLEKLWDAAPPVTQPIPPKPAPEPVKPSRKTVAKKAPAASRKKAASKKAPVSKTVTKKAAAKKAVGKKPATRKKAVPRQAAVKAVRRPG